MSRTTLKRASTPEREPRSSCPVPPLFFQSSSNNPASSSLPSMNSSSEPKSTSTLPSLEFSSSSPIARSYTPRLLRRSWRTSLRSHQRATNRSTRVVLSTQGSQRRITTPWLSSSSRHTLRDWLRSNTSNSGAST